MKRFLQKYYPEITGVLVFVTYTFTIGPSIGENDSGELTMSQATLSIPHPTGYPLFILIGYLFNKIPLPFTTVFKLNLLSAIWCSLTVVIVIRTSLLILKNFNLFLNNRGKQLSDIYQVKNTDIILISIYAGLMLAYSATFWLQSTRVEVYSFQIFLTSAIILLTLLKFINNQGEKSSDSIALIFKKWWLLFLFIGFGFSNHLMTLYLLPATIIIFFFCEGLNKKSFASILLLFLISGLVASLFYLGLMLRAKMNPPWSYGDPSTLKSLFDHATAKEYSKYMLQSFDAAKEQSGVLLKMLSFNFSKERFSTGEFSLSFLVGIAGLLLLFLFRKEVVSYLILILITSITLAFSYKIPDINEYFLVPFLILSILSIFTLIFLVKLINNRKKMLMLFYFSLIFLISTQFAVNFNYADHSDDYLYEDFYKASISELPPNSVLLTDKWSIFIAPGLYFKDVENVRTDISIISVYSFIFNDWYRRSQRFNILENGNTIMKRQNLFVGLDVILKPLSMGIIKFLPNSSLVPYPFYFRLVFDGSYYPINDEEFKIRLNEKPFNNFDAYIYSLIPFMLEQRIIYELRYRKLERASYYYKKIKSNFKDYLISEFTIAALKGNGIITK
ncbi:MAG TPA: DUF2723 domain-containing protein [Ignavibacteriaceae bacterium]|nr:DUF2723 domain-containing protein [Ignavibacteriaceae bacterium]